MDIWITSGDKQSLLKRSQRAILRAPQKQSDQMITVNADQTFQTMDGFGFTLTGGSAQLIAELPTLRRQQLLNELFSTKKNGLGLSYLRLSIGASDLSAVVFSYNDRPKGQTDFNLTHFDLWAGDRDVIPVLKQILAINPHIKLMGSPWSAPAWMKDNQKTHAGHLKPECFSVYAAYLGKYLRSMQNEGINIDAITVQNEPLNWKNDPSMLMSVLDQTEFIKNHLGPAFYAAGLKTKIICWDHNCHIPDYAMAILNDPKANTFTHGSAWHLYKGTPDAMSYVHDAYPDKAIYFTEQWLGVMDNFPGALKWHAKNVLIGATRNWARTVLGWNLAADPTCGPFTPSGSHESVGGITIGQKITCNVNLYVIAHASKFVPPGSVRVATNDLRDLPNVAFKTPGGRIVLIVLNDANVVQRFSIEQAGEKDTRAIVELPAGALATCVWGTKPKRESRITPKTGIALSL